MSRGLFQYHPTIGYQFIPGLKARVDHKGQCAYLVRVNGQGFRSEHEFQVAKTPGKFRVLLFGDSFTAGDGVSNKNRYSDVLEELLPDVEVYNMGLPGSGTDQQYLVYRELGSSLAHDLVVIAVQVENINRVNARFRVYADDAGNSQIFAKPYFQLQPDGRLALEHVPVPKEPIVPADIPADQQRFVDGGAQSGRHAWLRRTINRMGPQVKDLVQKFSRYQPLPGYDRTDDPRWQLMKAILLQWIGEISTPALVFPVPLYHYIEEAASPRAYQARFDELRELPNVIVHDPLSDFLRQPVSARRGFRFELDPHPTPAGHRVLAESLAQAIAPLVKRKVHSRT